MIQKRFGKKGMSSEMIWIIIILILALLLLVVFGKPSLDWIGETVGGFGKQAEISFSDCDLDRIQNEFDECPCIQRGETPHKDLLGCPVGTTYEASVIDRTTCFQYESVRIPGTYVAKCDGNTEQCKMAKTRCDTVAGTVVAEAQKVGEVATKGDLEWTEFTIDGTLSRFKDIVISYDLNNDRYFQFVKLGGVIWNNGEEDILSSFNVQVSVCSVTNIDSCQVKKLYAQQFDLNGDYENSYKINGLSQDRGYTLPARYIALGDEGDYCATSTENECWLKIVVDSGNKLSEPKENNEILRFVRLSHRKSVELFGKYQVLVSVFGGATSGVITLFPGDVNAVSTLLLGSNSFIQNPQGKFPTEKDLQGRCFIFAYDDDIFNDDIGAGIFNEGEVIDMSSEKILTPIAHSEGFDADAISAFEKTWKATTDGSLICKGGDWLLCSEGKTDAVLIGSDRFACRNQAWIKG